MSQVVELETSKDFLEALVGSITDQVRVAIDFYATWCGPCKTISPVFDSLAQQYQNVRCFRVDVDKCKEIAQRLDVQLLPTFMFYFQGKVVSKVIGAAEDSLREEFAKVDSKSEEELLTLVENQEKDVLNTDGNVERLIDDTQLEGLNFDPDTLLDKKIFGDILETDGEIVYLSDCDEQIIINMRFQRTSVLKGIKIFAPGDAGPKLVKLYTNKPNLDFNDVEDNEPTETLTLSANDLLVDSVVRPLNVVKFNKVNHLTIFIETNQEDAEQTALYKINLFGKSTQ